MSPDPESVLAQVRELCLALPGAVEKVSHGAPTFFIEKGKVFAYFTHNHHGDDRTAVQVKTSGLEEQAMLVEADPDLYYVPPYIGHAGGSACGSTSARPTGTMSVTGSRLAGNWQRRAGCWRQVDDERRLAGAPYPFGERQG